MLRNALQFLIAILALATMSFAGVTISSPTPGSTSGSPVHFVASASSSAPITAMRIYVDNVSVFLTSSNQLNTSVPLALGTQRVVVQAWDSTGAVLEASETIVVTTSSGAVAVSSPANNATVSSPFQVVASASAPRPIVAMIAYLDGQIAVNVKAASMNASVSAASGGHSLLVQAWDNTGVVYKDALTINVSSGGSPIPSGAVRKTEIQKMIGWQNCTVCAGIGGNGPTATISMAQFQGSPSLSGSSTKFSIASKTPYSDALWWKQLGADNSASNFVYDLNFYLTTPQDAQALEFDVNQSIGNLKFIFGTQCNIAARVWDVWNTAVGTWESTGVTCTMPAAFTWHHLTWQLKRSGSQTIFVALTFDGVTHYINRAYNVRAVGASELNVAFQMDMNSTAHGYSAWLDNVSLSYW